jgi:hypothetical protein
MNKIKIFLASSEELKSERLVIAELITKLNFLWAEYDISIRLVKWEYLDSSMGAQHKQEDYNDYLRQCDMCVVMYWTKFGMYTEIELETAYQLLNSDSCLKHMCVIFKEGGNMTDGLKSFRNKYETEHPELCNSFQIESQLKELIVQQIVQCVQYKLEAEHELLAKNLRKVQKLLTVTEENEPEYEDYQHEFQSAQNDLAKNESLISDLGRTIQNI